VLERERRGNAQVCTSPHHDLKQVQAARKGDKAFHLVFKNGAVSHLRGATYSLVSDLVAGLQKKVTDLGVNRLSRELIPIMLWRSYA